MNRSRILLVDDEVVFREGLRLLFSSRPEFDVVGEATDGEHAAAMVRKLNPDVVLANVQAQKTDGVETIRRIIAQQPLARVVVLTAARDEHHVLGAFRAGALGYVLKAAPFEKVCEAIQLAMQGESLIDPAIAVKLVAEIARHAPVGAPSATSRHLFSALLR